MKITSEPNSVNKSGFVQAALYEAARYESETVVPDDLVTGALARHERSSRRCGRSRLVPVLITSACGLVLVLGAALWLRMPSRLPDDNFLSGRVTAMRSANKAPLPDLSALPTLDLIRSILPPISAETFAGMFKGPIAQLRSRHWIVRHTTHRQKRFHLVHNASAPPTKVNCSPGIWTTETVHREVITETLTPVWVAQPDPTNAAIVLTPALFAVSLQPDSGSDPTQAEVSATLIPVRYEQENIQP